MTRAVQRTAEFRRVLALPRRIWPENLAAELAARLTKELRTPDGTQTLRPIQAVALAEIRARGGGYLPLRVGAGKTLVSFLAATVLEAERVALVVPANLVPATWAAHAVALDHWDLRPLRVLSYELLSHPNHRDDLEGADLIVLDEAHNARNVRSACVKRIIRACKAGAKLVAMSGTMTRKSLRDGAHLLSLALGAEYAPIPDSWSEIEAWSSVIDDGIPDWARLEPGALFDLVDPDKDVVVTTEKLDSYHDTDVAVTTKTSAITYDIDVIRRAWRRRLVETPGVVATDQAQLGTSLVIERVPLKPPPEVAAALKRLHDKWELPDGTELTEAADVWRHARELAYGFWLRWDPPAPKAWLEARAAWSTIENHIVHTNRRMLDSPALVREAVLQGRYPGRTILETWLRIEPTFTPTPMSVWISKFAVVWAEEQARREPQLIWVEHHALADAFEERGLPVYGEAGRRRGGDKLVDHTRPEDGAIVVTLANREGHNLQAWSRSLMLAVPEGGDVWEQLIGRTHRDGQKAGEVIVRWLSTCKDVDAAFDKALSNAGFLEQMTGQPQKLLYGRKI